MNLVEEIYKAEGYIAYVIYVDKEDDVYTFTYHKSTESGYEEDLDVYSSKDYEDVKRYVKQYYDYEI